VPKGKAAGKVREELNAEEREGNKGKKWRRENSPEINCWSRPRSAVC